MSDQHENDVSISDAHIKTLRMYQDCRENRPTQYAMYLELAKYIAVSSIVILFVPLLLGALLGVDSKAYWYCSGAAGGFVVRNVFFAYYSRYSLIMFWPTLSRVLDWKAIDTILKESEIKC
jgi:hypothetical protein